MEKKPVKIHTRFGAHGLLAACVLLLLCAISSAALAATAMNQKSVVMPAADETALIQALSEAGINTDTSTQAAGSPELLSFGLKNKNANGTWDEVTSLDIFSTAYTSLDGQSTTVQSATAQQENAAANDAESTATSGALENGEGSSNTSTSTDGEGSSEPESAAADDVQAEQTANVVAPGTGGSHTYYIVNETGLTVDYSVTLKAVISGTETVNGGLHIPIEVNFDLGKQVSISEINSADAVSVQPAAGESEAGTADEAAGEGISENASSTQESEAESASGSATEDASAAGEAAGLAGTSPTITFPCNISALAGEGYTAPFASQAQGGTTYALASGYAVPVTISWEWPFEGADADADDADMALAAAADAQIALQLTVHGEADPLPYVDEDSGPDPDPDPDPDDNSGSNNNTADDTSGEDAPAGTVDLVEGATIDLPEDGGSSTDGNNQGGNSIANNSEGSDQAASKTGAAAQLKKLAQTGDKVMLLVALFALVCVACAFVILVIVSRNKRQSQQAAKRTAKGAGEGNDASPKDGTAAGEGRFDLRDEPIDSEGGEVQ